MKAARFDRPTVPVVLPLADVTIDMDGAATVSVDGAPYDAETRIERGAVADKLESIASQRGPLRVRVTESDGSEFTDVIVPAPDHDEPQSSRAGMPGIAGHGFLPDEDVDVAVVIARQRADAVGNAHLRVPLALLARRACVVVLVGRASGAVTICDPT